MIYIINGEKKMSKVYCIYHKNCLDGFTSAWVVNHYFKKLDQLKLSYHNIESLNDIEYIEMEYGDTLPELVPHSIIYIVDFSFPPETIQALSAAHNSIYVFDHHKTAIEKFEGIEFKNNVVLDLDVDRAGCQITWDHFFDRIHQRPLLVEFVADRDLWKFVNVNTKPFCRALSTLKKEFKAWDVINKYNQENVDLNFINTGYALLSDDEIKMAWHFENTSRLIQLKEGLTVFATNTPKYLVSEVNDTLLKTNKIPNGIVAAYHDTKYERVFRLNSLQGSDVDVSIIAKEFGGGGHKHSASFKVDREHRLAKI